MKLTKKKANEVSNWSNALYNNREFEAIQGVKDSVSILFKEDDKNAQDLLKHLTFLQEEAEKNGLV